MSYFKEGGMNILEPKRSLWIHWLFNSVISMYRDEYFQEVQDTLMTSYYFSLELPQSSHLQRRYVRMAEYDPKRIRMLMLPTLCELSRCLHPNLTMKSPNLVPSKRFEVYLKAEIGHKSHDGASDGSEE